jgi:hypothetical protein
MILVRHKAGAACPDYDPLKARSQRAGGAARWRASMPAQYHSKRGNMPTVRLSPTEVQVDNTVYTFESSGVADDFEACVATVDVGHCETKYLSVGKRDVNEPPFNEFPVD